MQNNKMKIIGVTGGVGAGKSQILKHLEDNYRAKVVLADNVGIEVEQKGEECYRQIVEAFGTCILDEDGNLDRAALRDVVFSDEENTKKINSIIHPAVIERIKQKEAALRKENKYDFYIIEAALLIECGFNSYVDEMWYIYTDINVRRERLKASRGYTDEQIDRIIAAQLSDEEFRNNSDFVIDNSGDFKSTYEQIDKHMLKLLDGGCNGAGK